MNHTLLQSIVHITKLLKGENGQETHNRTGSRPKTKSEPFQEDEIVHFTFPSTQSLVIRLRHYYIAVDVHVVTVQEC